MQTPGWCILGWEQVGRLLSRVIHWKLRITSRYCWILFLDSLNGLNLWNDCIWHKGFSSYYSKKEEYEPALFSFFVIPVPMILRPAWACFSRWLRFNPLKISFMKNSFSHLKKSLPWFSNRNIFFRFYDDLAQNLLPMCDNLEPKIAVIWRLQHRLSM